MKSNSPDTTFIERYHLCFVIVSTVLFLAVMFMNIKQGGSEGSEEGFFQKNLLIATFNRLRLKMGDRVFNNVLIGKDGWMEFTGDHNLDDYQNTLNFSPEGLETVAGTIKACHQHAKEHNMTFLIVVAPNKASIYPDKLPEQIQPISGFSRLDQLNAYLRTHNIPEVLDLRPALREARQTQDVYYKMGTHWNPYGAYVAYKTILEALSQDYPELKPYPAQFFRFRSNPRGTAGVGMDIAAMLKAAHLSLEPTLFSTRNLDQMYHRIDFPIPQEIPSYRRISWIPNSKLPSLLMYHDSFGDDGWNNSVGLNNFSGLNDFLGLNFRKSHFIHRNASSSFLNWQAIEQFSPDIMIFEIVERNVIWMQGEIMGCAQK